MNTSSNGTKVHIQSLHEAIERLDNSLNDFRKDVVRMLDKQDDKIRENTKVRYRVKIYDYLVPITFAIIGYLINAVT